MYVIHRPEVSVNSERTDSRRKINRRKITSDSEDYEDARGKCPRRRAIRKESAGDEARSFRHPPPAVVLENSSKRASAGLHRAGCTKPLSRSSLWRGSFNNSWLIRRTLAARIHLERAVNASRSTLVKRWTGDNRYDVEFMTPRSQPRSNREHRGTSCRRSQKILSVASIP